MTAFAIAYDGLVVLFVITAWPFAWILRDGLGPSAVESSGWEMFSQTAMTFYVGPVTAVLVSLAIVVHGLGYLTS